MTIEITGTFADGKNARVLHEGNRLRVKTVTASDEVAGKEGDLANAGDTVDKWVPFANEVLSPSDFGDTDNWTHNGVTIGSDGLTMDEGTATGFHILQQAITTVTATEWVVGVKIEKQTLDGVQVHFNDGTTAWSCTVNLRTNAFIGGTTGTWDVIDLGDDTIEIRGYFTPAAASTDVKVVGYDVDTSTNNYTGTNRTVKVLRVAAHESAASLTYEFFGDQVYDCAAIAAHNLGDSGGRFAVKKYTGAYVTIDVVDPADNAAIMMFFDEVAADDRVRLAVSRAVLPEIGVFRVGSALKMERPFYGGFAPAPMARQTSTLGNLSGTGDLLGRSNKRTILSGSYQWQNLTYTWVRANLDGKTGLIQSAEANALFIAWRPSETEDVDYVMRASTEPPQAQGTRDLWSFSMSGEVHSYE